MEDEKLKELVLNKSKEIIKKIENEDSLEEIFSGIFAISTYSKINKNYPYKKNENIVKKWKEIDLWAKEYIEKLIHKETKTLSEEKAKAKAIEIPINNKIYIPKTKVEYEEELERRRNLWG